MTTYIAGGLQSPSPEKQEASIVAEKAGLTSTFSSPIYDKARQQGHLARSPTLDKQAIHLNPRTLASKRSTDTFGIQESERATSPLPVISNPSIKAPSAASQSTAIGQNFASEDMQDSDEAPYSDSELGDLHDDVDGMTPTTTMNSIIGKRLGDSFDDLQEQNTIPQDAFPKPPPREGVQLVTHINPPIQINGTVSEQKHTVGGLSHSKSSVKIHRKASAAVAESMPEYDKRRLDENDAVSVSGSSIYRSAGLRSNLAEWAPSAQPANAPWSGISNLPDFSTMRRGEPTAKPIVNVQRDLDWSMRRLLNENVFEQLVNDDLGRHRFREFLAQTTGTENKLDMYFDLCQYAKQNEGIRQASEALHDVYLAQDSDAHITVPEDMGDDFYDLLKKQFEVRPSFEPLKQHLLLSLYRTDFKLFVKSRLVEQNKVKLGSFNDDGDQSGLGDCYCLTNPRLRENPIVLVSPGFETVTGYPRQQIIGRNCRFLQGPGTAPDSVQRIRDALNGGEPCTELLLNYRRDGSPFFCLLTIIPLRDATGTLVYFIGGQTNVNGQLASAKGLKFLLGGGGDTVSRSQPPVVNGLEVSPSLARHIQRGAIQDVSSTGHPIVNSNSIGSLSTKRGVAAGAYDPLSQIGPNTSISVTSALMGPTSKTSSKSGPMSRIFGKKEKSTDLVEPSQRLLGAEATMRKDPYSLEDQMQYFTALYSKVIIFKRTKREIIFATREVISFFDLPMETWKDVYASPLVHADLLSIVQGANKEETRLVQQAIQVAVKKGESISVQTGIKQVKMKKRFLGVKSSTPDWVSSQENLKYTTLHITPLRDRDNSSFAFVALFG